MAEFETVSTSCLQIKVKVPRSPSPCQFRGATSAASVARSTSMRHSRLDKARPPTSTNHLSVNNRYCSRSLSPRPPSSRSAKAAGETRPPPPSPSGLLPTRSPTPPLKTLNSLQVPGVSRTGQLTPRSLSTRCNT